MAPKKKVVKKAAKAPLAPLAQRVGSDPALLAKALANPGLRSKLPDKYLSATQREQRQGNLPVVPGSSLTNRAALSQADTNTALYFGPNAQAKQEQQNRDVLGWYDQYKADLAAHAKNIGDINASGNAAISGLSQGIRPLADQALAEQKAREAQNSAVTGSTPQDQTKTASDASAVRQAMIAALGSAEAGRGSARQSYADTLANVVAPGYKLQAGAQGQQSLRDLTGKMSAYKAKQFNDLVAGETASQADLAKQKLAFAIATGHDLTGLEKTKLTTGASKANAATSQAGQNQRFARGVNKYGVTNGAWADWGKTAAGKAKRQKAIDDYNKNKGGAGKSPWANQDTQGKTADQIGNAKHYAGLLKSQGIDRHTAGAYLLQGQEGATVYDTKTGKPKLNPDGTQVKTPSVPKFDSLYASIALDIAYDGHISASNIKRLHARGIKVNSLGYPTKGKPLPKVTPDAVKNIITGGK